MDWIYIIELNPFDRYVGATKRLYRRFFEHGDNKCMNTSDKYCQNVVAIYKAKDLYNNFIRFEDNTRIYDRYQIANDIVECLMVHDHPDNAHSVRGGKYIRGDISYTFPNNITMKKLPLCNCGLPCDVCKKDEKIYFRCPVKNFYHDFRETFHIKQEPCVFYQMYKSTYLYKSTYPDWSHNIPKLENKVGSEKKMGATVSLLMLPSC